MSDSPNDQPTQDIKIIEEIKTGQDKDSNEEHSFKFQVNTNATVRRNIKLKGEDSLGSHSSKRMSMQAFRS